MRNVMFILLLFVLLPRAVEGQERREGAFTDQARNATQLAGWITVNDTVRVHADLTLFRETVKRVCVGDCEIGDDALDFSEFLVSLRSSQSQCPRLMVVEAIAGDSTRQTTWNSRRGEQCLYSGGLPVLTLLSGNPIVAGAESEVELDALTMNPMSPEGTVTLEFADSVVFGGNVYKDSAYLELGTDRVLRLVRSLPPPDPEIEDHFLFGVDTAYVPAPSVKSGFPWGKTLAAFAIGTAVGFGINYLLQDDCSCEEVGGPINQPNSVVPSYLRSFHSGVPALAQRRRGIGIRIPIF